MKKLTLIAFLTASLISLPAADKDKDKDKDKGIPPGLQKKDKLPPGIAKKQGKETTAATPPAPAVPAPATQPVPPGPAAPTPTAPKLPEPANTPNAPTARQVRVDLDKRARAINTLDNRVVTRRAGLEAIAKETGVSVATLQAQHRQHQEIGTAGLLMANTIAAQTKRPAGTYLRQAAEGKPWARIAADGGVNLDELDAKLGRVEDAMRGVK